MSGSDQPRTAGLLLAAGEGRRYGMPKALVRQHGRLLVEHGLRTLSAGGCDPVLVVLGARAQDVRAQADTGRAVVVVNPDWPSGLGSSLRAGLTALASTDVDAVVVLLVDTPGVTAHAVRRLRALRAPEALAVASYDDEPGHPVLLGRAHWSGAAEAAVGDVGARDYLRQRQDIVLRVPCGDVAVGTDLDVPPPGDPRS
jgi:CTP:molybdopterin cytidylyltransferase MocA